LKRLGDEPYMPSLRGDRTTIALELKEGAAQGNRTPDLLITSEMLYRLS
jgi:hypothetical protein